MLDTHGRKFIDPFINRIAKKLLRVGLYPNHITTLGLVIGVLSGITIYIGNPILACLLLWFSGLLDVLDGAMARIGKLSSDWGSLLDIFFDRIVESSIILGLAYRTNQVFPLLFLLISILLSMTIFLTVGALCEKNSIKSFYYQAGLAERTEGFILFTLMILLQRHVAMITYIFTIMILFTVIQRLLQAYKLMNNKRK